MGRIAERADRLVEDIFQRRRRPAAPEKPYSVGEHLKHVQQSASFRRISKVKVPGPVTVKELQ